MSRFSEKRRIAAEVIEWVNGRNGVWTVCTALITARVLHARSRDSFVSVNVGDWLSFPVYTRPLITTQDNEVEPAASDAEAQGRSHCSAERRNERSHWYQIRSTVAYARNNHDSSNIWDRIVSQNIWITPLNILYQYHDLETITKMYIGYAG